MGRSDRVLTMDLKDVLKYQLESTGYQVDKVLEGLPEDQWDARLREDCMSPKEAVAHLIECYVAVQKDMAGHQHEWGAYMPADDAPPALMEEMRAERRRAWDGLIKSGDEKAIRAATQYIVLHDAYHVGQLATLRLGLDPKWDPYSIYS
jgi:hypothetical protein